MKRFLTCCVLVFAFLLCALSCIQGFTPVYAEESDALVYIKNLTFYYTGSYVKLSFSAPFTFDDSNDYYLRIYSDTYGGYVISVYFSASGTRSFLEVILSDSQAHNFFYTTNDFLNWYISGTFESDVFIHSQGEYLETQYNYSNGYSDGYVAGTADGYTSGIKYADTHVNKKSQSYLTGYTDGIVSVSDFVTIPNGDFSSSRLKIYTNKSLGLDCSLIQSVLVDGYSGFKLISTGSAYPAAVFELVQPIKSGTRIRINFNSLSPISDSAVWKFGYVDGSSFVTLASISSATDIALFETTTDLSQIIFYCTTLQDVQGVNVFLETSDGLYDSGYNAGLAAGITYADGRLNDSSVSYYTGYNNGWTEGIEDANDYTFFSLISSVVDVPIKALMGLLDFNVFGIDMSSLYLSLFTASIVFLVLKVVLTK